MNILTLDLIKEHLRLDAGLTDEDTLLQNLGEAAEEAVFNYIERSLDDVVDEYGEIPYSLQSATLMIVADLYKNREATTTYAVNTNGIIGMLLKPYSKLA